MRQPQANITFFTSLFSHIVFQADGKIGEKCPKQPVGGISIGKEEVDHILHKLTKMRAREGI